MNKENLKQTPESPKYPKSFIIIGIISALNIAIGVIIFLFMLLALLDGISSQRDTTTAIIFMAYLALLISLPCDIIMLVAAFIAKKFFGLNLQGKLKRYIIVALILSILPACFFGAKIFV